MGHNKDLDSMYTEHLIGDLTFWMVDVLKVNLLNKEEKSEKKKKLKAGKGGKKLVPYLRT